MLYKLVNYLGTGFSQAATICDRTDGDVRGKLVKYILILLALNFSGGRHRPGRHTGHPLSIGVCLTTGGALSTTGSQSDLRQWVIHNTEDTAIAFILIHNIGVP